MGPERGRVALPAIRHDKVIERFADAGAELWRQNGPRAISFGGVAQEAGEGKSLVSHHYPTRKELVLASARVIANEIADEIGDIASAFEVADQQLHTREDAVVRLVEWLTTDANNPGKCLLELAALAIADAAYAPLLEPIARNLYQAVGATEAEHPTLLIIIVFGELLQQSPLPRSPIGPAGLRDRIGLYCSPDRQSQRLVDGMRDLVSRPLPHFGKAHWQSAASDPDGPRDRIILAALDILARGDDPTHRAIAAHAGVSLSSTTYHFRSKTDILAGVYGLIRARVRERASRILATMTDGASWLPEMIENMLPYYLAEGPQATIAHLHLVLLAARTPELQAWASRAQETEIESLQRILAQAIPAAPSNVARATMSFISGFILFHLVSGENWFKTA